MPETGKTASDQVREIEKLVSDVQGKLDQVAKGLQTLQDRLKSDAQPDR